MTFVFLWYVWCLSVLGDCCVRVCEVCACLWLCVWCVVCDVCGDCGVCVMFVVVFGLFVVCGVWCVVNEVYVSSVCVVFVRGALCVVGGECVACIVHAYVCGCVWCVVWVLWWVMCMCGVSEWFCVWRVLFVVCVVK